MARKVRITFLYVLSMAFFFASIYHHLFPASISDEGLRPSPVPLKPQPYNTQITVYHAIHENLSYPQRCHHNSSVTDTASAISTVSILFPAWEVLVVVAPETPISSESVRDEYFCLYHNNSTSVANPAGIIPFPDRTTFKCVIPDREHRRLPFFQPVLTKFQANPPARVVPEPELLWWNFLVYNSLSSENDVVLFVKGVNKRQGINRQPTEFRCVFGDDAVNGVKTAVTSSKQEVFRCQRPELAAVSDEHEERIKVSLEFSGENRVVPSLAYYTPTSKVAVQYQKSLLCACTMVYNVAKFLKEWVVYHSRIGVEKFILYDNGSDDDLVHVVEELVQQGYDVETLFWIWPKTQEAGFSHSAIYAKESCRWMMYIDVDEFVFSPLWSNSSQPSKSMLTSLLPSLSKSHVLPLVGQIMIGCHEFGPSNQNSHPVMGVMQGYNCRRRSENRHKSIVLLDAVDDSLLNVIHHFKLKAGYRVKKLNIHETMVNHYKFQAWPEFKTKFKRRVSAYVADWTQAVNPNSNDRAPGLGFSPVEPKGWPEKFCEVHDNNLKKLTQRWFGVDSQAGYHMAWQR